MNSAVILITLLAVMSIVIVFMAYRKPSTPGSHRSSSNPKKSIKLISANGSVLFEYKDLFLSRSSNGVYKLSKEYEGESIVEIDKGADMLLLVES